MVKCKCIVHYGAGIEIVAGCPMHSPTHEQQAARVVADITEAFDPETDPYKCIPSRVPLELQQQADLIVVDENDGTHTIVKNRYGELGNCSLQSVLDTIQRHQMSDPRQMCNMIWVMR